MTKLTNKLIADLPIKSVTYIVWDDEIKGLGIRINDMVLLSFNDIEIDSPLILP